MPAKTNNKMMYYLGDTGCEDWNQALDDYLQIKKDRPQITWHNFYIARKEVVDSFDDVIKNTEKEIDINQGSGIFRA